MDETVAKMTKMSLNEHKIYKGFALVIVNTEFKYHQVRTGADKDRENIKNFCNNAGFTVNDTNGLNLKDDSALTLHDGILKTDNLAAQEMKDLFKIISTGDFSSYDAFICFISSHGGGGGVFGVDGETVPVQYIVDQFKPNDEYRTLVDKPKLFFTQNCRGPLEGQGIRKPVVHNDDGVQTDIGSDVPFTIPTEADILVAYATVDQFQAFRFKKEGSLFIITLTQVLNQHAHNMNLTDMLALVNEVVGKMTFEDGKKQMPCFTSTLRKAIHFHLVHNANEKQPSAQESEELPAASGELPAAPKELIAV